MPTSVEHRTKRDGTLSGCQKTTTTPVTSSAAAVRRSAILESDEARQCRTGSYGRGRVHGGTGVRDVEQQQATGPGPAAGRQHEPTSPAGYGPEPRAGFVAFDVRCREDRSGHRTRRRP